MNMIIPNAYRKKTDIITAFQWFRNGDHPEDFCVPRNDTTTEGEVVRYYRTPNFDGQEKCEKCGMIMHFHGWIDTLEFGHIVCPGDWIIKGLCNEFYPVKPGIFEATYEKVREYED